MYISYPRAHDIVEHRAVKSSSARSIPRRRSQDEDLFPFLSRYLYLSRAISLAPGGALQGQDEVLPLSLSLSLYLSRAISLAPGGALEGQHAERAGTQERKAAAQHLGVRTRVYVYVCARAPPILPPSLPPL